MPHRFKKIGLIITPMGLFLWIAMQIGWVTEICQFIGLSKPKLLNMFCAILGFFSFFFGSYILAFSKERIEDEMIKNIRLESFQFAALLQMIFLIVGLIWIGFMGKPPKDAGMMLFFIITIFIFWIIYITRFNYIVHIATYKNEK
ncbi:hypothetical protein JM658_16665 [Joostella atrarenae]|uniref:DUF2178 domain-containing protein n=1 Tax=Joostella atrarenae TaxID=679257 RepID=A0ABS9J7Q4_9FLAO|nr:hypothetical protein [Joostella atrarenae]MCF8716461.1 hypothetical protein [Joostella atrarenae]